MQNTDSSESRSLAQIVCSWAPEKLSELAQQYSKSCNTIQYSFSGYDNYKNYFEPLLFAELAAELATVTDKFSRGAAIRNPKVRVRREEAGTVLVKVCVKKVSLNPTNGWLVDLDTTDNKGPVGCVDGDIVALWTVDKQKPNQKTIPSTAVLATVQRPAGKNGVRINISSFPDGNENGGQDLEDGEESEKKENKRFWCLLRVGSLTTIRREHLALLSIKKSPLLPILLRPSQKTDSDTHPPNVDSGRIASTSDPSAVNSSQPPAQSASAPPVFAEQTFTSVVANKMGLNQSQAKAVALGSMSRGGITVIQGPPGTGKTRTLIALLNVIHMTQYQQYYEGLLASLEPMKRTSATQTTQSNPPSAADSLLLNRKIAGRSNANDRSLLETMMTAMNKTVSTALQTESEQPQPMRRVRRPRLLVCAPSNSAIDEVLTRLTKIKFFDGQGRSYGPELARIGAGEKISDAAKPFTAEMQAEHFLDKVCNQDMSSEAQLAAQMAFLGSWQTKCNTLLVQLQRTPKTEATRSRVIDLHEQLERMDRDLRRLKIAVGDPKKVLTREEKLRRLARTYVEDAQLVFSTLSGSASSILTSNDTQDVESKLFDTVVIDEAAQSTEPSCLIPLCLGATRCLLVGDPQQLPATVLSSGAAAVAYGQSLLDRVCRAGKKVLLLDTQYRMHPAISSFPRRYFYEGQLKDDETVQGDNRMKPYHHDAVKPRLGPYVFLDVSDGEEHRSRKDKSVFNPVEAELATVIYNKLKKEYGSDSVFSPAGKAAGSSLGFGVVTPYKRQMHELRQAFDRAGVPTGDVEIDTVDSYQGREKEVVIFSCVRTAINYGIGFVKDVRRMNVGLTRARSTLIVLGSAQALAEGSKDWAELIDDARSRGCLISVSNVQRALSLNPDQSPPRETVVDPSNVISNGVRVDPRRAHKVPQDMASAELADTSQSSRQLQKKIGSAKGPANLFNNDQASLMSATQSALAANLGNSNQEQQYNEASLGTLLQALTASGIQYNDAMVHMLQEHISNGGAIDIETVMAVAIATGVLGKEHVQDTVGAQVVNPGTGIAPAQTVGNPDSLPSNSAHLPGTDPPWEQADSYEQSGGRTGSKRGRDGAIAEPFKKVQSKKARKAGTEKAKDKAIKEEPITPSGWDMLFNSKNKMGEVKHSAEDSQGEVASKEEDSREADEGIKQEEPRIEKKEGASKQSVVSDPRKSVTSAVSNVPRDVSHEEQNPQHGDEEQSQENVENHDYIRGREGHQRKHRVDDPRHYGRGRHPPKRGRHKEGRGQYKGPNSGAYYGSDSYSNRLHEDPAMYGPPGAGYGASTYPPRDQVEGDYSMMPNVQMPSQAMFSSQQMANPQSHQVIQPQGLSGPSVLQHQLMMQQQAALHRQAAVAIQHQLMQQQSMHQHQAHGMHQAGPMPQGTAMFLPVHMPSQMPMSHQVAPQMIQMPYPALGGQHHAMNGPDGSGFGSQGGRRGRGRPWPPRRGRGKGNRKRHG